MPNLLENAGAQRPGPKSVPIHTSRFLYGLQTNRNLLRSPAGVIYDKYYGLGGADALVGGVNSEVSTRLTYCRRPGNTAGLSGIISSSNLPDVPDSFYSFHEENGIIRLFASGVKSVWLLNSTGSHIPIYTKNATTITNTVATGGVATITATNAFQIGQTVTIAGTTNGSGALNGTWVISASTATTFSFPFTGSISTNADTGTATVAGQTYFQGINSSLYFSDRSSVPQKWQDFGTGNPGNSLSAITGTIWLGGTNTPATITAVNNFQVGQTVVVSGTTNGGGQFNGTWPITAANSAQFQFILPTGTIVNASDTGYASATWNLGITAPTAPPALTVTASGSAAIAWQANTVFSTMGLIYDSGTTSIQQLISVNASGTNSTQFGTSGDGEPNWNQTPGGTTTDNGITWTNWGPIPAWMAHTVYNSASVGGTATNPSQIYDPSNKVLAFTGTPGNSQGTSGAIKPNFLAKQGANLHDPSNQDSPPAVKWYSMFPAPSRWKPSTNYPAFLGNDTAGTCVIEPTSLPAPDNQPVYLQISSGGTSGSGYTPAFSGTATNQVTDQDLVWQSLGSAVWTASTVYTPWSGFPSVFSAIKDSNGNLQVCVSVAGNATSGSTQPLQAWQAGHTYSNGNTISDSNGRLQTVTSGGTSGVSKTLTNSAITGGVATYTTSTNHGYAVGQYVMVTSSSHDPAFNVKNKLITSIPSPTTFTINLAHDDIGSAADTGNVKAGPTWASSGTTTDGTVTWTAGALKSGWGTNYGDNTTDGNVQWTCVGVPLTWAGSTIYHLPTTGFAPPHTSQPFGGSEIISGTSPSQNVQAVVNSGKSGNGSSPSFSTTLGNFTDDNTIVWQDVAAFNQSSNSLNIQTSYSYVYSYKARAVEDQYSPIAGGGLGLVPPGFFQGSPNGSLVLSVPTGSADGTVSTASPSATVSGKASGVIITVAGVGSTDPQVDTIVIYRTADGGGTYYELTEIPNPPPVQGQAQAWSFQDFLPDNATTQFPGLNTLVLGPVGHFNDPPLTGAINFVEHLGRLWYSVGATVYASDGPLVGGATQPPGNGFTQFNPAQFWEFTSPVVRLVPTNNGLLVFTTSDLGSIVGGPSVLTLTANLYVPGLALSSYNALDIYRGIIYLYASDSMLLSFDPNQGISEVGYAIGDQLSNNNGQTSTFNPSSAYVAFLSQGSTDKAVYIGDGLTGWFRGNPYQSPDVSLTGTVWGTKANIVGGAKAVASLEVAQGRHALVIGGTTSGQPILVRDSTYNTFTDNGSAYPSNFVFGNAVLASPGQIAGINFITCEFAKTGTSPKLSVLADELRDTVLTISQAALSGQNTTYTYTLAFGAAPFVGMPLTISGMADAGNNGTFEITSTGVGTFTVVNSNGVNRSGQNGTTTRFEDLSGYVSGITGLPPQDPVTSFGLSSSPSTNYSNRYYAMQGINGQTPSSVYCRHCQIKVDYGSTDTVQNEILSQTIYGSLYEDAH